jgi:hypothetical protein
LHQLLDPANSAQLNAAVPELRQKLSELLDRYHRDKDQVHTEADVSANFVDQLFAALGWDIFSALEYNRQRYVREAGYADVGLLIAGEPKLFVEVKRFGLIPKSSERRGDRTPEEKQAFKYARQEKIRWAVLTNFERLHVFDADQERLILAFDDPREYIQRIEELNRLARPNIERESLEHFASLQAKEDIDRHFLENLMRWRKLLAQDILDRNANNDGILTAGKPDLDKLRRVVQRILDRLVIIRFADDRELLDDFGVMEGMLAGFQSRRRYAAEGQLYRDFLGFCAGMDRKHNTEIFSPKHPCELVAVGNDCLEKILDEITTISFRKFTSDILGNTYESYLGHRLELEDGHVELAERRDLRKGAGIYYTPPYIVRYIVDQTLGKKLEELEARHGLAAAHEARKLKVLDPACGSGSFLIYAFDVLAAFYERCNQRITAEKVRLLKDHEFGDVLGTQDKIKTLPSLLFHYPKIILEENLYGVDLDEEAAELAGVNLIMKAFDRVTSNGRKLPLILNQNIKVGNSLIGCVPGAKLWEKTSVAAKDVEKIIALRQQIRATDDDTAKRKLLEQAEQQTRLVTEPLNVPLKEFFADPADKRPFHWPEEFPEVFARENPGFDIVIGNPPYGTIGDEEFLRQHYTVCRDTADAYVAFMGRCGQLSAAQARIGQIVPQTWQTGITFSSLRIEFLRDFSVEFIINLPFDVFPDAYVDTGIAVFQKKLPVPTHEAKTFSFPKHAKANLQNLAYKTMPQATWQRRRGIITLDPERLSLLEKFSNPRKMVPLGKITKSARGILARAEDIADQPKNKAWKPFFTGKLDRYEIEVVTQYVHYSDHLPECPDSFDFFEGERILVRRLINRDDRMMCVKVTEPFVTKKDIYSFKMAAADFSASYVLALLNSRLFSFAYTEQDVAAMKDDFRQATLEALRALPIRTVESTKRADKALHNEIAELAENLLRFYRDKAAVEKAFAEALNNHPHEWKNLGDTYWNRPEYVSLMEKKAHVKAGDTAEITALRCELDGQTVQISAKAATDWNPVLDMAVADDKLRFFIFYGIRQFLRDNARKRKWGEDKLLQIVLEKIQVPVFFSHGVYDHETHRNALKLVLAEMKKKSPLRNLTELERDIATTDDEIDKQVFALYGLTDKEIKLVKES